ncbi:hypothetical protein V496_01796 [Pseudogymnoascus sp. VKM F-4515 (FW-2607)]|nr:hypothetical protein V496_01796 [Pseudogymnoascus sp. VKM F-4515 (FW-2607)]KFY82644.1 hypothetical protein V498_08519 [Pseudogymnoascus sp. VKM F-4517 (FW-2822)]
MADPLSSTAASIVSITVPALHGARLLLNDLHNIVDAPKAIATVKEDIQSVEIALEGLKAVPSSEWDSLGEEVANGSKLTVMTCAKACESFRQDLQQWTRHSGDGNLSWRDRANVGFFKQERINLLSQQLRNCKATVSMTVSIATLHSSIRHGHTTEDLRDNILKEDKGMAAAIAARDVQIMELQHRTRELLVADTPSDLGRDKAELLDQINQQLTALAASRKVLEGLISKSRERTLVKVTNVRMSEGGRVVAGLVNTQGNTPMHISSLTLSKQHPAGNASPGSPRA